jgi:DNA adenine methylase
VNDLDCNVVNFFRVIQNPESCQELQDWFIYTSYSRQVYDESFTKEPRSPVEQAGHFAVRFMQSHGFRLTEKADGRKMSMAGKLPMRFDIGINYLKLWADMAIRLKGVQIENRPALELIRAFDHENVLIYLDPPYVWSTRGRKQYRHEMSDQDHEELLETVISSKAKIMISGYDCELYEKYLKGWRKLQIPARAQNSLPRTETLWMNFEPINLS